jgi:hypothetical protein
MIHPAVDLFFLKTPLTDDLYRGDLMMLEPFINSPSAHLQVRRQIVDSHQSYRNHAQPLRDILCKIFTYVDFIILTQTYLSIYIL